VNSLVLWDHIAGEWLPLATSSTPIDPQNGYPDATNTGYSGSLTTVSSINAQSNTVYENLRILNVVNLGGKTNVTIRNCLIEVGDYFAIDAENSTNCIVEDTTLINTNPTSNCCILDNGGGNMYRRLDISGSPDGIKLGSGSTLRDSWIHNLASYNEELDTHNDGIQGTGAVNVSIIHNRIAMGPYSTSAIAFFAGQVGTANGLIIDSNWISGGGYSIYLPGAGSTNVKVRNNIFGRDYGYAIVTDYVTGVGNEWINNTFADNGDPINP